MNASGHTRIETLDYLRGITAFGIMIFHYSSWSFGTLDIQHFVAKLGIYGVSIFYVLSGLTLYHVYEKVDFSDKKQLKSFYVKRLFRILPLLWLAIALTLLVNRSIPSLYILVINITGVFGVIDWAKYIAVGSWSIGNELFFYITFPLLLVLMKRAKVAFYFIIAVIAVASLYFSYTLMSPSAKLSVQWSDYVNPLNQWIFFVFGVLMGYIFKYKSIGNALLSVLFMVSLSIFIFFPLSGDAILIVTGNTRAVYILLSLLLCFSFYKTTLKLPKPIEWALSTLGRISYSLYLLHPFCWAVSSAVASRVSGITIQHKIMLGIVLTLFLSYFSYKYFETFFIGMGKKVLS